MTDNSDCHNCAFNAEKFYGHGSAIDVLKAELAEMRTELQQVKSDIDTFKIIRESIGSMIKTLWMLAGFVMLVAYDWIKAKFFK